MDRNEYFIRGQIIHLKSSMQQVERLMHDSYMTDDTKGHYGEAFPILNNMYHEVTSLVKILNKKGE